MTTRWLGWVVVGVVACGPSKGGSTEESSSGAATETGETPTTSAAGTTSVGTEPTTDATTGDAFNSSCEMFFANRDAAAGILVYYNYGNQIEGSELRIFMDGSVLHSERTCCPPVTDDVPETLIEGPEMTVLRDQAAAVLAGGSTTTDLGPMADGQATGIMCVLVNGETETVLAYEPGVNVTKRMSTAPEADAIAALVRKYASVDMPE